MGNKTIYVKDEALWERAKELAGKEGFSAVIAKALAEFVQRTEDENRRFTEHSLTIGNEVVRFRGRSLASTVIGIPPGGAGEMEVYVTKGGKLVLVARNESGEDVAHEVWDTLPELAKMSYYMPACPAPEEFLDELAEALAEAPIVWID
jgi:hypothetical protein